MEIKDLFKDLESALTEQISSLKSATMEPSETAVYESISFDYTEKDHSKWLAYISQALKTAKTFEIHCWNEETEWIGLALQYGKLKENDWQYGKMIAGDVTPEFIQLVCTQPKPADTEIYNKMTPFFTIALDNGFWSEHYGTELNIEK